MSKSILFAALAASVASVCPAAAQNPDADKTKRVQQLRAEIAKTQAKLDALNKELATLVPPQAAPAQPKAAVGTLRHEFFKGDFVAHWCGPGR